jgi:hypothetical protein
MATSASLYNCDVDIIFDQRTGLIFYNIKTDDYLLLLGDKKTNPVLFLSFNEDDQCYLLDFFAEADKEDIPWKLEFFVKMGGEAVVFVTHIVIIDMSVQSLKEKLRLQNDNFTKGRATVIISINIESYPFRLSTSRLFNGILSSKILNVDMEIGSPEVDDAHSIMEAKIIGMIQ